jgi:hypothetical protein
MRQPPLYTWVLMLLKPSWAAWEASLEFGRYLVLLAWLAGVQALARACGASPRNQARVLLAHLGLLLVMWRVHDSLTHTVLAAAVTLWGSVALVRALDEPRWWPVVGLAAAAACLSKLNAALWCVSSFLSALIVIWQIDRADRSQAGVVLRRHLRWVLLALGVFCALMAPYVSWWLSQRGGPMSLASRIVVADAGVSFWRPVVDVFANVLEYLLLVPLVLSVMAWCLRRRGGQLRVVPLAGRWVRCQALTGLLLLLLVIAAMKGSHFTPRWLWPVVPGLTVWLCVRALDRVDQIDQIDQRRWRLIFDGVITLGVVLAFVTSAIRWWEPALTARQCQNCWTDRPATLISRDLHARYGHHLRIVTGDDHLAGVLAQVGPGDLTWTAVSPDLPAPAGFAAAGAPCVGAWVDMDEARPPPPELSALIDSSALASAPAKAVWSLYLAPKRKLWLGSVMLAPRACEAPTR